MITLVNFLLRNAHLCWIIYAKKHLLPDAVAQK